MRNFHLSATIVAEALALPAFPPAAQTNAINIDN